MSGVQQQGVLDQATDYGAQAFVIQQALNRLAGPTLVRVIACTSSGSVAAPGIVDVQPLVNQLDGAGKATPHGTVHSLPFYRLQGGGNAAIIDPVAGDIGLALFCSRDISNVKATRAQANPASARTFDWADGLYLGAFLGALPTQYAQFAANDGGITVVSPTQITLQAPTVTIAASTELVVTSPTTALSGALTVADDEVVGFSDYLNHTHGGVQTGSGDTGPPVT